MSRKHKKLEQASRKPGFTRKIEELQKTDVDSNNYINQVRECKKRKVRIILTPPCTVRLTRCDWNIKKSLNEPRTEKIKCSSSNPSKSKICSSVTCTLSENTGFPFKRIENPALGTFESDVSGNKTLSEGKNQNSLIDKIIRKQINDLFTYTGPSEPEATSESYNVFPDLHNGKVDNSLKGKNTGSFLQKRCSPTAGRSSDLSENPGLNRTDIATTSVKNEPDIPQSSEEGNVWTVKIETKDSIEFGSQYWSKCNLHLSTKELILSDVVVSSVSETLAEDEGNGIYDIILNKELEIDGISNSREDDTTGQFETKSNQYEDTLELREDFSELTNSDFQKPLQEPLKNCDYVDVTSFLSCDYKNNLSSSNSNGDGEDETMSTGSISESIPVKVEKFFECRQCHVTFRKAETVLCHEWIIHKIPHMSSTCEYCEESLSSHFGKTSMSLKELLQKRDKIFTSCDLCSKSFSCVEHLKMHKLCHSNVKKPSEVLESDDAEKCSKLTADTMKCEESKTLTKDNKCVTLLQQTNSDSEACCKISSYISLSAFIDDDITSTVGSEEAKVDFSKQRTTGLDLNHRNPTGKVKTKQTPRKAPRMQCRTCGDTFGNLYKFVKHREQVHPRKGFSCDVCGEKFAEPSTLSQHEMAVHLSQVLQEADSKKLNREHIGCTNNIRRRKINTSKDRFT